MSTIKDVASAAGVSLGTVSNVLNNRDVVSTETRERVLKAIKRLNYVPNQAARILKTKVSGTIGLIIPDINNPVYPETVRGAEDVAKLYEYSIFLCNEERNPYKEREYIRILIEKNVDGIIFLKPKLTAPEIRASVTTDRPFVIVDTQVERGDGYGVIEVDDYSGSYSAYQHLYDNGHRRIAYISGLPDCLGNQAMQRAYFDFHKEHNLKLQAIYQKRGAYDGHSGYKAMLELVRLSPLPTAVYAANDLMAIGAIQAACDAGFSIPRDISIVGSDDIEMDEFCQPRLTTVARPRYEMGKISMKMLIDLIRDKDAQQHKTLKTTLIRRNSVHNITAVR